MGIDDKTRKRILSIVFWTLLLDLLAFTAILPLFPRLVSHYLSREAHSPSSDPTLLRRSLALVRRYRALVRAGGEDVDTPSKDGMLSRWDATLLGGFTSSVFSLCQFVASPWIGALSDRYGRKPLLLLSLLGNILSAFLWLLSTSYASFFASRLVGGISEANAQVSVAIISDVTTPQERSRGLMLVGLAFSVAFTLGPSLGAFFAARPLPPQITIAGLGNLNIYAFPALITLALLLVEFGLLAALLPETRPARFASPTASTPTAAPEKPASSAPSVPASAPASSQVPARPPPAERLANLRRLSLYHFAFLLLFSGAETTLTFLAYDSLGYSNAQNGRLLGFIGVLSAVIQGGFVRRAKGREGGEVRLVRWGVWTAYVAVSILASLPVILQYAPGAGGLALYAAGALFAYTSATVVSSLNGLASLQTDDDDSTSTASSHPGLAKGLALGRHRSWGQLGRAIGPILTLYWLYSPTVAYVSLALALYPLGCFVSLPSSPRSI